jgi:hypothetical protein
MAMVALEPGNFLQVGGGEARRTRAAHVFAADDSATICEAKSLGGKHSGPLEKSAHPMTPPVSTPADLKHFPGQSAQCPD